MIDELTPASSSVASAAYTFVVAGKKEKKTQDASVNGA